MLPDVACSVRKRQEHQLHSSGGAKGMRLPQIQLMCARYWLYDFTAFDFGLLSHSLNSTRRLQALLHLVYGQLLIARKQVDAFKYLDKGLRLADGIIKAKDYFIVFNRHEALRSLRLTSKPGNGLELEQLLNEAAVIDKISQRPEASMTFQPSRFDTLINKSWN